MYEKELESVWQYIINDSGIKILFVNTPEIFNQVKAWQDQYPTLEYVFLIPNVPEITDNLQSVEQMGQQYPSPIVHPTPNDLAAIIYTSGTTGDPKGVMLSHGNCSSNALAAWHLMQHLNEHTLNFSHLPWAHSYGFTAEVNAPLFWGGSIVIMDTLATMAADMQKVHPTTLFSVPRVFNLVHHKVFESIEEDGGMKEKLFHMALAAAKKKRETGKAGFMYNVLNKLVFGKIRESLGGSLVEAFSGSAKMNPDIAQFFTDIGINVYDCYGLTECSPIVSMNDPKKNKPGTVGHALDFINIVIDKTIAEDGSSEGEIVVYGPCVMQGYWNKPEKTAEVMIEDGGLRTGDQGHLDEDGFLSVTGRFKEEYKLTNGKYVFPATIEEELKLLPYVSNAFVTGEGKPYNVALIVPNKPVLEKFVKELQISIPVEELLENKEVQDLMVKEMGNHLKSKLGGYEIPRKLAFIEEDFTIENGMLTQTLKVKQRVVVQKYHDLLESLYADELPDKNAVM